MLFRKSAQKKSHFLNTALSPKVYGEERLQVGLVAHMLFAFESTLPY